MKNEKTSVVVRFGAKVARLADSIARREGLTRNAVVVKALRAWLARRPPAAQA